jgi:hypothetical protein
MRRWQGEESGGGSKSGGRVEGGEGELSKAV